MSVPSSSGEIAFIRSEFADDAEFAELLQMFAQTLAELRERLPQLHGSGEIEAIRIRAHQLKGAGGGYGFPVLSAAAAELEQACKNRDAAGISRTLGALLDLLARVKI